MNSGKSGEAPALLSRLFEALPVGVLAEDSSRTVLAVNQRMLDIFEFPDGEAEIVGQDCVALAAEVSSQFEDSEGFVDHTDHLVENVDEIQTEDWVLEDGRTVTRTYRPIDLPDSEGHLWTYQDVTATEEAREEIARSRERLRLALEAGEMGIWEIDLETEEAVVRSPHHDRIFGYEEPVDEWTFDRFLEHVHPDDRETVVDSYDAAFETGSLAFECRISRTDDEERWIRTEGTFYVDDEDEPDRGVGVVRDVTDQKSYERELERLNERLDEFASMVSHDIRNPLSISRGRLDLYEETGDPSDLEAVDRSLERIQEIVTDMTALARYGAPDGEHEMVSLPDVARDAWALVDTREATLTTEPAAIRGDESQLQSLLENLFRNAIGHGGSDVTIRVGDLGNGFYVEDTGTGIPPDQRAQVFDHGYTTGYGGSGIGLTIVKRIAEAHSLAVAIAESDEGGARFEFTHVDADE